MLPPAWLSGDGGGDGDGEGGAGAGGGRGRAASRRASIEVTVAATGMLSAMSASPWLFMPSRNAATVIEMASAIRLQPSTRGRALLLLMAAFSSASRASDSQASMASATSRARVGPFARRAVLTGELESGALGGALGSPLAGAGPPNVTRLLTGGGLASPGDGQAWAAGPADDACGLG